jgi:hypothetical protein
MCLQLPVVVEVFIVEDVVVVVLLQDSVGEALLPTVIADEEVHRGVVSEAEAEGPLLHPWLRRVLHFITTSLT